MSVATLLDGRRLRVRRPRRADPQGRGRRAQRAGRRLLQVASDRAHVDLVLHPLAVRAQAPLELQARPVEPPVAATLVMALVQGLGGQLAVDPNAFDRDRVRAAVVQLLAPLFGITADRQFCKNTSITAATRMIASRSVWNTSLTDSEMNGVVSYTISYPTPAGNRGRNSAIFSFTRRAASRAFVPGSG